MLHPEQVILQPVDIIEIPLEEMENAPPAWFKPAYISTDGNIKWEKT
jgi:hypothetical protein